MENLSPLRTADWEGCNLIYEPVEEITEAPRIAAKPSTRGNMYLILGEAIGLLLNTLFQISLK
jgi:hypothetical protein